MFAKVLQGPYVYLLILLILIVSALLLTLIWLIIVRLREMPMAEAVEEFQPQPRAAPPETEIAAPIPAPIIPTVVVQAAPAPRPIEGIDPEVFNAEKERAKGLEQDNNAMLNKVQYLESKLLEYEILQEEIGALSALKMENERLNQELLQSRLGGGQKTKLEQVAPDLPAAGAAESPLSGLEGLVAAEGSASQPSALDPLPEATDEQTRSQLDGILQQIEQLTDSSNASKPQS